MDIFFNNIYKSRKTCLEMLEDRYYDISDTVTFTADDTIDVTVQAGPATGATTGTLTMYLIVG